MDETALSLHGSDLSPTLAAVLVGYAPPVGLTCAALGLVP